MIINKNTRFRNKSKECQEDKQENLNQKENYNTNNQQNIEGKDLLIIIITTIVALILAAIES